MTARKANPIHPPNPTGKGLTPGGRPGRISKENRDLVDNLTIALEVLGGKRLMVPPLAQYFVNLGKKSPTALASVVSRAMPLQIKAEAGNLQIVVQQLVVSDRPVAGVISSPIQEHVQLLEARPALPMIEEVIDAS